MRMKLAVFVAAAVLLPVVARAQEYCVACTEPAGLYRCIIDNARPGTASSLQVVCISRIAQEGKHGQCSVKRGVTVFECDGIVKRISMAAEPAPGVPPAGPVTAAPPAAGTAAVPGAPQTTQAPAPVTTADPNEPPKTVAEMARRAKADSDRQMKEAGNFFKKSLGCIASLFTKCGGDE